VRPDSPKAVGARRRLPGWSASDPKMLSKQEPTSAWLHPRSSLSARDDAGALRHSRSSAALYLELSEEARIMVIARVQRLKLLTVEVQSGRAIS
jgi:hypothetical protein